MSLDKNYTNRIVDMLGVYLNEPFNVKKSNEITNYCSKEDVKPDEKFMFSYYGLYHYNKQINHWEWDSSILADLIYGNYEIIKPEPKKTIVISAFPACGKTYACGLLTKEGYKVLDSDNSKFSWLPYQKTELSLTKSNGIKEVKVYTPRNPEFPRNYIDYIKENIGKVDYIFVSSHKEVRDALLRNKIPFKLVYPYRPLKAEWIGRCYLRDGDTELCDKLAENWDKWLDEIENIDSNLCEHYELDEYFPNLYDLIKHNFEGE